MGAEDPPNYWPRLLAVADEADGEVDAIVSPPALLLFPDLVEHGLELRLQVRRRLGPWLRSHRVHDCDATDRRAAQ